MVCVGGGGKTGRGSQNILEKSQDRTKKRIRIREKERESWKKRGFKGGGKGQIGG